MAQIIRSGAFLQQCWSVHPLCVTVRRMTDDRTLVLSCSSCKSAHYLVLNEVISKAPPTQTKSDAGLIQQESSGEDLLKACVATHHAAITLREMDIFQDRVLLRCADCRRLYESAVSTFETHHK